MIPELMKTVEQVVRPLLCGHARKMQMRHELYALLEDRYRDNCQTAGLDPDAEAVHHEALDRAIEAFGNPEEIRLEMQATIPLAERWSKQLDHWMSPDQNPSFSAACQVGVRMAILMAVLLVGASIIASLITGEAKVLLVWQTLCMLPIVAGINTASFLWLGNRAAEDCRQRRWRPFALQTGSAIGIFCGTVLALQFVASPEFMLTTGWKHLLVAFPFATLLFALVTSYVSRERSERADWTKAGELEVE